MPDNRFPREKPLENEYDKPWRWTGRGLTPVSEGDRDGPATYLLLRPDNGRRVVLHRVGACRRYIQGLPLSSFVRNWSLSMRLLSVAPYLTRRGLLHSRAGNTCNLANSKGFSPSSTPFFPSFFFFFTISTRGGGVARDLKDGESENCELGEFWKKDTADCLAINNKLYQRNDWLIRHFFIDSHKGFLN